MHNLSKKSIKFFRSLPEDLHFVSKLEETRQHLGLKELEDKWLIARSVILGSDEPMFVAFVKNKFPSAYWDENECRYVVPVHGMNRYLYVYQDSLVGVTFSEVRPIPLFGFSSFFIHAEIYVGE